MQDELAQLIELTYQKTGIAPGLIEKDYYVTRLINIISRIKNDYFKLVFAGGTCLAKAHRITKRMSEDVDFKVQKHNLVKLATKKHRTEFSKLRNDIVNALKDTEFKCDARPTEGRNTHVKIYIDYPAIFPKDPNNREYILLELTISEIRLPIHNLSINTLIQDMLGKGPVSDSCSLECVSIEETAAEKWVALTRRVAESIRSPGKDQDYCKALVRHIYDLFVIVHENKLGNDFISLAKSIVLVDKEKYKRQHKEYYQNPKDEIIYSLDLLQEDKFLNYYENFIESLVYQEDAPSYKNALNCIVELSNRVMSVL